MQRIRMSSPVPCRWLYQAYLHRALKVPRQDSGSLNWVSRHANLRLGDSRVTFLLGGDPVADGDPGRGGFAGCSGSPGGLAHVQVGASGRA